MTINMYTSSIQQYQWTWNSDQDPRIWISKLINKGSYLVVLVVELLPTRFLSLSLSQFRPIEASLKKLAKSGKLTVHHKHRMNDIPNLAWLRSWPASYPNMDRSHSGPLFAQLSRCKICKGLQGYMADGTWYRLGGGNSWSVIQCHSHSPKCCTFQSQQALGCTASTPPDALRKPPHPPHLCL